MANLQNWQEYAQCVSCGRVFVVSLFSTSWCNYDRSGLQRIGRKYPADVKVGP